MRRPPAAMTRALLTCEAGVTAIEFAFISPVLLLMTMGTLEVSTVAYAQHVMEGAAYTASRTGKTGYNENGKTREQTIIDTLKSRAGVFVNADNITFTTLTYAQFNQIGQPEPFVDANSNGRRDANENYTDVNGNAQYDDDMGRASAGNPGEVTVYTIRYNWPIHTPALKQFIGTNGQFPITARAVVKNEPF